MSTALSKCSIAVKEHLGGNYQLMCHAPVALDVTAAAFVPDTPTRNTWQDYPCFLHVMHQSWMSVLQGLAIQESCHASCILHVCHMQGQSTLHCKMDGRMDARTMPCILHSACMSHARTVHPPLQDGWTDGCKNHAMHLAFCMYVTCKDSVYY